MRSLRYDGAWSLRALYVRRRILNMISPASSHQNSGCSILDRLDLKFEVLKFLVLIDQPTKIPISPNNGLTRQTKQGNIQL